MFKIELRELIHLVPDLVNLFLSGFIFMVIYNWLNNSKIDITLLILWSLFISILIKSFCSFMHSFIAVEHMFNYPEKVIIYTLVGVVISFSVTYIKNTWVIRNILYITNRKSTNSDIFDDVIDYDKRTMMTVFIKESAIYYIGKFSYREENGLDSWISLIDYARISKETNEEIFNPNKGNLNSSVIINLHEVERIEIIYEQDSKLWAKISGNMISN